MSLEALAFALLIGGQLLAAIVSISNRAQLYPGSRRRGTGRTQCSDLRPIVKNPRRTPARVARFGRRLAMEPPQDRS
jgi:hypothetical protein